MTRIPELPSDTLIVSGWASYCNNCGKDANPNQGKHIDIIGYKPKTGGGCGQEWNYVYSEYGTNVAHVLDRPHLDYHGNIVDYSRINIDSTDSQP